ncbi:hypothetical protein RvY_08085-2 [Ramazzottius varieornatus]|uniref:CUB domain-containing protein n=1 Tax=Ramazzottius varieornatus TaxID=947166 RepID=A0A1D1V4N7_RAMVA|nr:hypothetical protein RvY_08085-2 [Ramazzottius varieornatus]
MEILVLLPFSFFALLSALAQDSTGPTGASIVPVVGSCHKIVSGTATTGKVRSHDGFPSSPYSPGYQCRTVISVPFGRTVEVTVGGNNSTAGLRPWDYAVLVDGSVSRKLSFMCDVDKYKKALGRNGEHFVGKSKQVCQTIWKVAHTIRQ